MKQLTATQEKVPYPRPLEDVTVLDVTVALAGPFATLLLAGLGRAGFHVATLAEHHLPANKPGGDSSCRRHIPSLALRPGDEIRIEGVPDREEHAALDFVEIREIR